MNNRYQCSANRNQSLKRSRLSRTQLLYGAGRCCLTSS